MDKDKLVGAVCFVAGLLGLGVVALLVGLSLSFVLMLYLYLVAALLLLVGAVRLFV